MVKHKKKHPLSFYSVTLLCNIFYQGHDISGFRTQLPVFFFVLLGFFFTAFYIPNHIPE